MSFHGMDRELKMYPSAYLEGMLKIMNIPSQSSLCLPRFYTESPRKDARIATPSTSFLGFETEMHFWGVGHKN
jgi:hypothetical protein